MAFEEKGGREDGQGAAEGVVEPSVRLLSH